MTSPAARRLDVWSGRLVVAGLVLAAVSLVDGGAFIALVQAAAATIGALLLLLAVLAGVARRWWRCAGALLSASLLVAPVVTFPAPTPPPGHRTLSVLAANTYDGAADPAVLMDAIVTHDVDVLVLPEMNGAFWRELTARGLTRMLPYSTGRTGGGPGMVLATREPVTCLELPPGMSCNRVVPETRAPDERRNAEGRLSFDQITVRLGDGTVVRGVHQWSPRLSPVLRWREQQEETARWIEAQPAGTPLVLAGDFNAGRPHPVFRRYSSGFDRSPRDGWPWTRTWPTWGRFGPFTQIDHVLARGWRSVDSGTIPMPGSDHRAVWSRLER